MKKQGNDALAAGNNAAAVNFYTQAIELDPKNHVLWSNRSAAHAKAENYSEALVDAKKTVELKPDWSRGYSRLGAAHHGLHEWEEATAAYKKGLELEPNNATFKSGIADVEKAREAEGKDAANVFAQFANYFNADMINRVRNHPQVASFINDPGFLAKAAMIRANPATVMSHFQDKNVMTYISVCTQLSSGFPGGPFGGADAFSEPAASNKMDVDEVPKPKETPKPAEPAKAPEPELTEDQKKVLDLKNQANTFYTSRKFDEALELYKKALEIEPNNVNILVNCTAVYFEKGEYEKCISACEEAINVGREQRADYKLIARAMTRLGTANAKLGNSKAAIEWYNKSLTEFRDANTLKLLRDLEKRLDDEAKNAYINPELAAKAKDEGNDHFKAQRYPDAIASYTEAVKRDPSNPVYLTNRAVAFTKLGEYPSAVKDCDAAIALDPKNIKAFLRKGQAYHLMREYTKAMETFEKGLLIDPENAELTAAHTKTMMTLHGPAQEPTGTPEEIMARAMAVPEVREILEDPVMREILQQMTSDPAAAADHLRNPEIRRRINILKAHGVIRTN